MLVKSQVKYIQSLSQKKQRDEEGLFVAEGPKIINEFLQAPNLPLRLLFATQPWMDENPALAASLRKDQVELITESELERISFLTTPNQVLALFEKPEFPPLTGKQLILVLDRIQDPGNLGTIIRCADWFGIRQVVCSPETADVFSPKVVQSTMGSLTRVQLVYTDLSAFLQTYTAPVFAALLEGKPVKEMGKQAEGAILIGNESKGIHPDLLKGKNLIPVTIPRIGAAESLNAAVATGILLSQLT